MRNALILVKAKNKIVFDNMTKGIKILCIIVACAWTLMLSIMLVFAQTVQDDIFLQAYGMFIIILVQIGMQMVYNTGNFPIKGSLFNKKVEYDLKKVFFHLPFLYTDFIKSVYISWLRIYCVVAGLDTIAIIINHICGTSFIKNRDIGFGTFFVIFFSLIYGIRILSLFVKNQFNYVFILSQIFNVAFCISFVLVFNLSDKIIPSLPFLSFFGSLYGIVILILVPIIIYGITKYLTTKYDKKAWFNS